MTGAPEKVRRPAGNRPKFEESSPSRPSCAPYRSSRALYDAERSLEPCTIILARFPSDYGSIPLDFPSKYYGFHRKSTEADIKALNRDFGSISGYRSGKLRRALSTPTDTGSQIPTTATRNASLITHFKGFLGDPTFW